MFRKKNDQKGQSHDLGIIKRIILKNMTDVQTLLD